MARSKIDAKEALDDLHAGMDDHALMAKYRLSAKGLQSLFTKLIEAGVITQELLDKRSPALAGTAVVAEPEDLTKSDALKTATRQLRKKTPSGINALDAVRNIRAGLSDGELMDRYRLSARGLQSLYAQLIGAGLIKPADLNRAVHMMDDTTVEVFGITEQLKEFVPWSLTKQPKNPAPWRCPACGSIQTIIFDDCTVCGVNYKEFEELHARRRGARYPGDSSHD
jgi:hypothetical protein